MTRAVGDFDGFEILYGTETDTRFSLGVAETVPPFVPGGGGHGGGGGGGGGGHGGGGGPGAGKAKWVQAQLDHIFSSTRLGKYARWHPSVVPLLTTTVKKVVGAPATHKGTGRRRRIPTKLLREILEQQGNPWAKELVEALDDAEAQKPKSKKHAEVLRRVREEVAERIDAPIDWGAVVMSMQAALSASRTTLAIKHADAALRALRHHSIIETARRDFERRQKEKEEERIRLALEAEEDEEAALTLLLH